MINPWASKGVDMMFEISMRLAAKLRCVGKERYPDIKAVIVCLQRQESHMIQVSQYAYSI